MVLHLVLLILAGHIPHTAQLDPWHMALIFVTLLKRKHLRPNVQEVIKCAYNFLLTFIMNIDMRTFTWASSVLPQSLRYPTSFAWNQQFFMTLVYIPTAVFSKFKGIGNGGIHSFPVYICHVFFLSMFFFMHNTYSSHTSLKCKSHVF